MCLPDKNSVDSGWHRNIFGSAPMRMNSIISAIVLAVTAFLAMPIGKPMADASLTRVERCNRLQQQVQHALAGRPGNRRVAEARALQKKAIKFCAGKKQAQGIRAFAQALKLLGEQPVDQ